MSKSDFFHYDQLYRRKLKNYLYSLFIFSFLCINTGCIPKIDTQQISEEIGNGGVLSQIACGLPCFWNILPGTTEYDDVIGLLDERAILKYCEYEENSSILFCLQDESDQEVIGFGFNDLKSVTDIVFRPIVPIMLGEFIAVYGDPTDMTVWVELEGNDYVSNAVLFYDDIQSVLFLPTQYDNNFYDVNSNTLIEMLHICSKDFLQVNAGLPTNS